MAKADVIYMRMHVDACMHTYIYIIVIKISIEIQL